MRSSESDRARGVATKEVLRIGNLDPARRNCLAMHPPKLAADRSMTLSVAMSQHPKIALRRKYDATPDPKLVIAMGDCGCTGGIFGEGYASCGRVSNVIPVDVAVSGCPPSPSRILSAILTAISRSKRVVSVAQ